MMKKHPMVSRYHGRREMKFDVSQVPFSRFGTYLSVFRPSLDPGCGEGLYLRTHHAARVGKRDVMRIEMLVDGVSVPFVAEATATELRLTAGRRRVRLCMADAVRDTVRIRGEGAGVRLRAVAGIGNVAQPMGARRWSVNARQSYCRFMASVMTGRLDADCPWQPRGLSPMTLDLQPDGDQALDAAIDRYGSTWEDRDRPSFDDCVAAVERDWRAWLAIQPTSRAEFRETARLAAYVNWASGIRAGGLIARPAILMSKVQMDNVWSWDHCFNAMALSYQAPELAFDQWMTPFDRQDEFGALPDACNPAVEHFNFCKPPVHGWALQFLMDRQPAFFTRGRLAAAYDRLSRWTDWWLTHRRMPGDALPYYLHGNDSGWDNATMFDAGAPLVAPDLAAFLAVQCETVGRIAAKLGKPREARRWEARGRTLVTALLDELWKGDRFVARRASDRFEVRGDSLVPAMPILLGRRLPPAVARALVARLRLHLTEWGLATERTTSAEYTSDGYWRGPVWAPCTMVAVAGLSELGYAALAKRIALRFCRLCAKSGFAENFDAIDGAPLRDTAYTWTSSTFLVLAHAYTGRVDG